jgi:hypothetical protein
VNFHERQPELTQTSPIGGGSRERLGVSQMLDHLGGNVFTPKSTGIFFGAHRLRVVTTGRVPVIRPLRRSKLDCCLLKEE